MQCAYPTSRYTFFIFILGALFSAIVLGTRLGLFGYLMGFVLGAAVTLVFLSSLSVGWTCIEGVFFRGIPLFPMCQNGCCQGGRLADPGDYTTLWNRDGSIRGFQCRCGNVYQKVGGRFVELGADSFFRPYLIWSPLRGWCPDHALKGGQDVHGTAR